MADHSFWSRLKNARLVQVLVVYLGASWAILQGVELFQDGLGLPDWIMPVALILLAIGLFIVLITAWVQSHPLMEAREAADEVPGDWELALSEVRDSLVRGEVPHPNWARAVIGGVFVFSLLFGAAGLYVVIQDRGESFQPPPIYAGEAAPSIAVLPFRVSSDELEEWEEGLVDLLSTGLDGAAGLRAVDSRTVLSSWDRSVGGALRPDLTTALGVARDVGARFALDGSVTSIGSSVRLEAQVHDLENGRPLGTAQVDGTLDTPHELVDAFSLEILRILLGGDSEDLPRVDLAAVTTTSTPALKAYLLGERRYRQGRFDEATEAYLEAVTIDSTFALAHHRLFLASGWGEFQTNPLRRRHRDRALELVDRLPERERLLVTGAYRMNPTEADSTELETPLEEAVELYPNDAEAWYLLAETYFHEGRLPMDPEEIEETFARAIELDPDFPAYRIHHVEYAFRLHGDSAMIARRIAGYRELVDAEDPLLERFELGFDLGFGDSSSRPGTMERIMERREAEPGGGPVPNLLVHPRFLEERESIVREVIDRAAPGEVPSGAVRLLVQILSQQGRMAEAVELLDHPRLDSVDPLCLPAEMIFDGLPAPRDLLRSALSRPPNSAGSLQRRTFSESCRMVLATELGDREIARSSLDRIREFVDEARAQTDSAVAEQIGDLARSAEAFLVWKEEDRLARAAEMLELLPQQAYPRVWLAQIYRELGRLEDAETAYRTAYFRTSAWYRLASLYRDLGDVEAERDAWERVLTAWEEADPAIQPRVEEARTRLAALED